VVAPRLADHGVEISMAAEYTRAAMSVAATGSSFIRVPVQVAVRLAAAVVPPGLTVVNPLADAVSARVVDVNLPADASPRVAANQHVVADQVAAVRLLVASDAERDLSMPSDACATPSAVPPAQVAMAKCTGANGITIHRGVATRAIRVVYGLAQPAAPVLMAAASQTNRRGTRAIRWGIEYTISRKRSAWRNSRPPMAPLFDKLLSRSPVAKGTSKNGTKQEMARHPHGLSIGEQRVRSL
jgi:hypothetical protein